MKRPSRRLKTRLLTIGMIIIFGMAALSPLSPEAEVKTRLMVDAIGIDANASGIAVSCQTVSGGASEVVKGEGESLSAAFADLNARYGREVEVGHCGLIALGADTDKPALVSLLMSLLSDAKVNAGCSVVSASGSAAELMANAVIMTKASDGVTGFVTFADSRSNVTVPSVLETMQQLHSRSGAAVLPVLEFEKQEVEPGNEAGNEAGTQSGGGESGSSTGGDPKEQTEIVPVKTARVIGDGGTRLLGRDLTRGLVWTQPRAREGMVETVYETEGESITIRATLEERSFSLDAEYAPRPRFTFRSSARLKFTDRYSVLALAERGRTLADLFDGMNAAYERTMREELERIARDSLGEDDYLGYRTRLYRADPDAYRESGGSLDGAELIFDIKAEVV